MHVVTANIPPRHLMTREGIIVPQSCVRASAELSRYAKGSFDERAALHEPTERARQEAILEGDLVAHIEKPCESMTRWFGRIVEALLSNPVSFSLQDTANNAKTINWQTGDIGAVTPNSRVEFGTSGVAVTTTDFDTGTAFGDGAAVFTNDFSATSTSTLRLTGTLVAPSATTIREVTWLNDIETSLGSDSQFMIMRETFTDTALAAGDAIAGRFTLKMDV